MKLCPFFYDLQDVMEDRASTKPLLSIGCELEQEDNLTDKQESRREESSLNDIADKLLFSDDDDDSDASIMKSDKKNW